MDKISKKNTLRRVKLSRCYRLFLFYIVISVEGAMNISAGLMSSATKEIKQSLNMNDAKFGMFGTLNGIGRVIGSTLFGMYNLTVSRKWIQTICVGFHAIFLLFFKLTNNWKYFNFYARIDWVYPDAPLHLLLCLDRSIWSTSV